VSGQILSLINQVDEWLASLDLVRHDSITDSNPNQSFTKDMFSSHWQEHSDSKIEVPENEYS